MKKSKFGKAFFGITAVTGLIAGSYMAWQKNMNRKQPLPIPQKGSYALITGASSGIGAEFARQLATAGFNLVLVARREQKLAELAAELETAHDIIVKILVADLAQSEDQTRVEACITELNLGVLINSAGFGTAGFLTSDLAQQIALLNVQVIATMRLCRAAVPGMVERGQGIIINVSSVAAFSPVGGGDINYPSSKAYMNAFSQGLQDEVLENGIIVQALCPGFTVTEFHDTDLMTEFEPTLIPTAMWMTTEDVVKISLQSLDPSRPICVPGRLNQLMVTATKMDPTSFVLNFSRKYRQGAQ